jgi:predicted lipoprotein with Yx(FWY)xxD motif
MFKLAIAAALLSAGLAACGNNNQHTQNQGQPTPAETTTMQHENKAPSLQVRSTSLGKIVVDGQGHTVYTYADDKQGAAKSECKDACLAAWPAVAAPAKPDVDDLSGDVGVTKDANGHPQLTYNGWPLYHFRGDLKAGDTNGQGMKGEWYVLNPAGEKVKAKAH